MHPARALAFDDLIAGLEAAKAAGHVSSKDCPAGRRIYIYTNRCVYENGWNDFSLIARGLIVHPATKRVLATPFPKFFNAGERNGTIPDLPFEVFEKVDGSLGILHCFDGMWRASTKGAFDSEQARWIEARLAAQDLSPLDPETTYLIEAVYPENRIVVHYDRAEMVILSAYAADGSEVNFDALSALADRLGWRAANRYPFASFSELVEHARLLPATEEGFVIRFSDGLRLKLKGDEYRRIHSLISRCTPLAIWEAMQAGDDLEAIRRDLPEEFWADFDAIIAVLTARVDGIKAKVAETAHRLAGATDKEVGLQLRSLDQDVQSLIFPTRKAGGKLEGKAMDSLFRMIRPTGNSLPGYTPSYAMHRIVEEAA
jgi:RNA ligase